MYRAGLARRAARETDDLVLAYDDLLDQVARADAHLLREVEGADNLGAQHRAQALDACKKRRRGRGVRCKISSREDSTAGVQEFRSS